MVEGSFSTFYGRHHDLVDVHLMSLPHARFDLSNMAGVLQEAETAYSSGAPESTPGFWWGPCCSFVFSFWCCVCVVFVLSLLFSGVCQLLLISLCLEYPIGISLFLLLPLSRCLCWWTICPRGHHQLSSSYNVKA